MALKKSILWFKRDLRLSDNPALVAAAQSGEVLPVYIVEPLSSSEFERGSASKIWLYHSLKSLNSTLNNHLNIYTGDPVKILLDLTQKHQIETIFWNTCYEPWSRENEKRLIENLKSQSVSYDFFNGTYLWKPKEIKKNDGTPYKVFSAYKREAWRLSPREPLEIPGTLSLIKDTDNQTTVEHLKPDPVPAWSKKITSFWDFGESAAQKKLKDFTQKGLQNYKKGRDFPDHNNTSCLSPHLHFGEISPHQIREALKSAKESDTPKEDLHHFFSEITWREFSCYLLYHFNGLPSDNFQSKFNHFPWEENPAFLKAWQTGMTGIPFVDAGMRELWQTGYMHNRVRMIVASFLTKNLLIHWHKGRDHFWDCLVDADLANNSASWQWVAGCGADAAPYFRIFNPVTQGEKFDPEGNYTRKFVPELKNLPNKYLFKPWEAPEKILEKSDIVLGKTYPKPIVDLKKSREKALSAFQFLKNNPLDS
tara:strand:- start:6014 stop:7450 length:1437 start_codon:yes stop_codon:yes gene_type:complete